MKTTPLYELSVAFRGRSKFFRLIVAVAFVSSVLISTISLARHAFSSNRSSVQSAQIKNSKETPTAIAFKQAR
jgi:hypothetical protein